MDFNQHPRTVHRPPIHPHDGPSELQQTTVSALFLRVCGSLLRPVFIFHISPGVTP